MDTIIEIRQLVKDYPGVRAIDHVDFSCYKGEIHGLVGENGAGKSTLVKILSGAIRPDEGEVIVKGERIETFDPQHALHLGIGVIYQELSLLPYMSVAENIFLGREPRSSLGLVDYVAMRIAAHELLAQLDCPQDVGVPVYRLNVANQQLVEIAKALSFNPEILIMDEPSASLADHELQQLFNVIQKLRNQGVTIVYISHRLEEIFKIANRVTILKDGQVMGTMQVTETDENQLIRMMVGRDIRVNVPEKRGEVGDVVLEVRGLTRKNYFEKISFDLRKGEILGVAGLVGAGRTELARAIFAADPLDSGEIFIHSKTRYLHSPRDAIAEGVALMPEDRKAEGLALLLSLKENIALPSLPKRQRLGFIKGSEEQAMVKRSVEQLAIQTPSINRQVAYLSGGNQQKTVLAKWINAGPEVIIFDEPTRGIDIGAKAEIYTLLHELASAGKAIIMISSELSEIIQLSDRIIVLSGKRLVGELKAEEATEEKVLALAYKGMGQVRKEGSEVREETKPSKLPILDKLRNKFVVAMGKSEASSTAVFLILALVLLVGGIGSDRFLSAANLSNLLRQLVILALLGVGQTIVILVGGIDLSVSSIATMSMLFSVGFMQGQDVLILPGILLSLVIGAIAGLLNAFAIIILRVPPIIATLGTLTIGKGVALLYTRVPIGPVPTSFRFFAHGNLGPIPFSTLFMVLILVLAWVLLYKSAYGRHVYAVGGSQEIARLSGIRVERVETLAYILSGLLAAVAGLYLVSRMSWGDPTVGPGLELESISAVLLGGTILGGGRGGLIGTFGGVLVFVVISNVFNQLGLDIWYKEIAQGLIILFAVSMYRSSR